VQPPVRGVAITDFFTCDTSKPTGECPVPERNAVERLVLGYVAKYNDEPCNFGMSTFCAVQKITISM